MGWSRLDFASKLDGMSSLFYNWGYNTLNLHSKGVGMSRFLFDDLPAPQEYFFPPLL